jgi:flagellar protein FliS
MSYSHAATAYRAREIQTATPGRLVVLVYDHIVAQLARATLAQKAAKIEERVLAISKARAGIFELMATLDVERGGDVAKNLKGLYGFFLIELQEFNRKPDVERLQRIGAMVSELRDAFSTIAADSARVPAA